jgi:hypothetical protein
MGRAFFVWLKLRNESGSLVQGMIGKILGLNYTINIWI